MRARVLAPPKTPRRGEGAGAPGGVWRPRTGGSSPAAAAADDGGARRAGLCLCVAADISARRCTLSPCRLSAARTLARTDPARRGRGPARGGAGGRVGSAYHGGSDGSQLPAPAGVGLRVPGSPVPQQPVLHGRQGGGLLCGWGRSGLQHPRAQPKILPGTQRRHYQVRRGPGGGGGAGWRVEVGRAGRRMTPQAFLGSDPGAPWNKAFSPGAAWSSRRAAALKLGRQGLGCRLGGRLLCIPRRALDL